MKTVIVIRKRESPSKGWKWKCTILHVLPRLRASSVACFIVGSSILIWVGPTLYAQSVSPHQIWCNLVVEPPATGDAHIRKQNILALDGILSTAAAPYSDSVISMYVQMMDKVNAELRDTVEHGASIWMMYNHGYIVKTPEIVIGFDVVDGYLAWSTPLPRALVDRIDVLFVSHTHGDHWRTHIGDSVMAHGGFVVAPSEDSGIGNVQMGPGETLTLCGLSITAHAGLHGDKPIRMFEVTTPNAMTFLHTGDNQTHLTLPWVIDLDVLMVNMWMEGADEIPGAPGICNAVGRTNPRVWIPGHFQEMSHQYNPGGVLSRVPFGAAYGVTDTEVLSRMVLMVWGEKYTVAETATIVSDETRNSLASGAQLYDCYPNPFNPATLISYALPITHHVSLKIFDLLGREVATLVNEEKPAGVHTAMWDASAMPSGAYIGRMTAGNFVASRRMLLMK